MKTNLSNILSIIKKVLLLCFICFVLYFYGSFFYNKSHIALLVSPSATCKFDVEEARHAELTALAQSKGKEMKPFLNVNKNQEFYDGPTNNHITNAIAPEFAKLAKLAQNEALLHKNRQD